MSLTPTNHAHGALHVIVDATGSISYNFYWFDWEVPRMGLQVPFAPYLLVVFSLNYIFLFTVFNYFFT